MKTLRWFVAVAVISVGCASPENGETGALKFRFGLGGCSSVPAGNSTLAHGGATELIVVDAKKHATLDARSQTPSIVTVTTPLMLTCEDEKCDANKGTLTLGAMEVGTARVVLESGGVLVDALTVKVADAKTLEIQDEKGGSGTLKVAVGKQLTLEATLKDGDERVYAKTPFVWASEGTALKPVSSTSSTVTIEGVSAGTQTVSAAFLGLSGTVSVVVE